MYHRCFSRQIEVELGRPVKLYLTSMGVTYGIAFKVNKEIKKGEITTIEFTPNKEEEFEFRCSVYCGSEHRKTAGKLIVKAYKKTSVDE